MTDTNPYQAPARRSWRRALLVPSLFFAGGLAAAGYVATQTELGASLFGRDAVQPIAVDAARLGAAEPVAPPAEVSSRIAELEARLAQATTQGGVSRTSSTSDRVNGLVLAFAARRALERSQPLGAVEGELRALFGASQPRLIDAISTAAKKPVTMAELEAELDAVSPALLGDGDGWFANLTGKLGRLIVVRDAGGDSRDPAVLLANAKNALEHGHVATAVSFVSRMPLRSEANGWIEKASRHAEAAKALDALEAAAFSGPVVPAAAPAPTIVPPITSEPVVTPPRPTATTGETL